ncbi:hypothetical protein I79_026254 [Cricetulus griseus]|uniref:Uncharacterized protein n=1 Tax=Cricetulus griseus TaxID=10029 RepID=G3IQD2_CRIGR|nr:hypothetical protein I79_026254 [Cricetulus griseus]
MPSALSRPTNPNWQGLKALETCSSPVMQASHNTYQGTAGLSARAEALPQASVVSITNSPATLSMLPQH